MNLVFLLLVLILPVSALVARRLPLGTTVKMALIWLLIFVAGVAIASFFTHR